MMVPSATDVWTNAVKRLRDVLPERTVQNWLTPIRPDSIDEEDAGVTLTLKVPNPFCAQYLQSRFRKEITQAVNSAAGCTVNVNYQVVEDEDLGAPPEPDLFDKEPDDASDASSAASSTSSHASSNPDEDTPNRTSSSNTSSGHTASNRSPSNGSSSQRGTHRRPSRQRQATSRNGRSRNGSPQSRQSRNASRNRASGDGSESSGARPPSAPQDAPLPSPSSAGAHLKPEYTFSEFIGGDGNRLARSAAYAVAESPSSTNYNPLLIYGGVGLGKTHLAQAIANHALEKQTAECVLYVSSDRFTGQFVQAVRDNRIAAFSNYYRQADLLIVDDVQFFGGKEKTQEEFFHIFNDLHQHGRQIVLCADRPPREIDGIEDRLLSRFQWGLSADIQRPDLETRIAILQRKAARQDLDVEPQVLELLAQRIDSNIRQLEGALNRLSALASLDERTLDLNTARSFLQDYVDDAPRALDASDIIEQVAEYHRLSTDDLLSRSRKQTVAHARQLAMYFCRELTEQSFASIGSRFGGRDHSTVIHAHKKISNRIEEDASFRDDVESLQNRIQNRTLSVRQ